MSGYSEPVIWNDIKIEYVGPLSIDYALDGKDRNAIVRLTNVGDTLLSDIFYQVAIQGIGNYPATTGDGGFAVFPNGGNIDLAPGESFLAQNWMQGVYETRYSNIPPESGETKEYNFDFLISFSIDSWRQPDPASDPAAVGKLSQAISFTHAPDTSLPSGSQTLSGSIAASGDLSELRVEVSTPYSKWFGVDAKDLGESFSFSVSVPERDDWLIRVTAENKQSQTLSLAELRNTGLINLVPSETLDFGFHVKTSASTPTGFWRGVVSESEQSFLLFPGQENWTDPSDTVLRATSLIQKYSFSGELLWQYEPGWETWGGDMTTDGSKVVFLRNPDITQYGAGSWQLGVLDGSTGSLLWEVSGADQYLEGLEAAISPDGSYVAAGSTNGAIGLLNGTTGELLWQKDNGTFGQVRKLVFTDEHLYIGSGDGFLVKTNIQDGSEVWKSYVGGWPFILGLSINEQSKIIAVGTKSKDTSVLDANTGEVLWLKQTGSLDAIISPDGNYVANFYGDIFEARTGKLIGQTGIQAIALFSSDSKYLIQADRGQVSISDLTGKLLSQSEDNSDQEYGSGEQSQWAYLSANGEVLLVASRDMDSPGERGITIWSKGEPIPLSQSSQGGSPQAGPSRTTDGDDTFDLPGNNESIDGGQGIDTMTYNVNSESFDLNYQNNTLTITDKLNGWSHSLTDVERVQFLDKKLAFDSSGHAGEAAKVLGAFLGADAVQNAELVSTVLGLLDGGLSYDDLLLQALSSVFGESPSSTDLVNHFHNALTGVPASEEVLLTYSDLLENGSLSTLEFARSAAEYELNLRNIDLVGIASYGLEY